jgi:hypothetical protein
MKCLNLRYQDEIRSQKNSKKNKRFSILNPTKSRDEIVCSGRVEVPAPLLTPHV